MRENWSYQLAWPPKENERGERESRAGLPLILAPQQVTERIHGHARQARPGLQLRFHHAAAGIRPHPRLPGRRRSEEHTSELQSLMRISYAVFCLTKKTQNTTRTIHDRY